MQQIECCDNDPVMKLASFEAIVRALENAGVRYLVADGLAVNAHGYLRFTKDVDFVMQLIPDNIERAFAAFGALGYRPTVPITAEQFAEAGGRWSKMNSPMTASTGV